MRKIKKPFGVMSPMKDLIGSIVIQKPKMVGEKLIQMVNVPQQKVELLYQTVILVSYLPPQCQFWLMIADSLKESAKELA